jgi:hypothetical protein
MSIADTGRFWEILVIPVLQIRPAASYYPDDLFSVVATNLLIDGMELHLASF